MCASRSASEAPLLPTVTDLIPVQRSNEMNARVRIRACSSSATGLRDRYASSLAIDVGCEGCAARQSSACALRFEAAPLQSGDSNISSLEPTAYRVRLIAFLRQKVFEDFDPLREILI